VNDICSQQTRPLGSYTKNAFAAERVAIRAKHVVSYLIVSVTCIGLHYLLLSTGDFAARWRRK